MADLPLLLANPNNGAHVALTEEKERLLNRLNHEAQEAFEAARTRAIQQGRPLPEPPKPLTAGDMEYPKFLYDSAGRSKLVRNQAEHRSAGSGWAEEPPKPPEPPKKKEE
jgi:hypothetical protein